MRQKFYKPKWTFVLIAVCIIVFIFEIIFHIDRFFSFVPVDAFNKPWTFVTSIFLHAYEVEDPVTSQSQLYLEHLLYNMVALFLFGIFLESRVGQKKFLIIFFSAGILGNIMYLITSFNSTIPALGASGAIFGILGLLTILYPNLVIWFGYVPIPVILITIFLGIIPSVFGLFGPPEGIAYEAHLAGLLLGFIYGFYLRKKVRRANSFY